MNDLTYKGQSIQQREDGYVNATQMAQANNYSLKELMRSDRFKNYLKALENPESGISPLTGVIVISQGFPAIKTTWVHPLVALMIAQDISPEFHVWCNMHIKTLMETGSTTLPQPEPLPRQLPNAVEYIEASEKLEKVNNLTLKELLRNQLIDELSILQGKNKALPEAKTEYTIGKVRATELGYSITEIGNGSSLGKWLVKSVPIAFEERVGKYSVKHYEVTPQLDTAIHTFFSLKKTMKG